MAPLHRPLADIASPGRRTEADGGGFSVDAHRAPCDAIIVYAGQMERPGQNLTCWTEETPRAVGEIGEILIGVDLQGVTAPIHPSTIEEGGDAYSAHSRRVADLGKVNTWAHAETRTPHGHWQNNSP